MGESTLRFAVETPEGMRSAEWRVWTSSKRSDLYLSARAIAGTTKVSFHESGDWREAFVSREKALPFVGPDGHRVVDRWRRPQNGPPGWTVGYHVIIPSLEVVLPPLDRRGGEVWLRPVAAPSAATYFSLLWATPEALGRDDYPRFDVPTEPVGSFDLPNGDRVFVVTYDVELTPEQRAELVLRKRQLRDAWKQGGMEDPLDRLRGGAWGFGPDESRFVIELTLAVEPEVYG